MIRDGKGLGHIILLKKSLTQKSCDSFFHSNWQRNAGRRMFVCSVTWRWYLRLFSWLTSDYKLQTIFSSSSPLFLSPECWHSWVCCPVTSLRNLCEIFWPGRNPIFIWDTNYLWTKYLYLVMQWQTIQWPVKMIEIYKLCHNWIVCQPAQPRSVNIPCQAWQWQRRRTGISEDERQNIINKEHNY